jgi:hypothetical protein
MKGPAVRQQKRSAVLIILSIVTVALSSLGLLRFLDGIRNWNILASYAPAVLPLYLVLSGFIWGAAGLTAAVGIWFHQRWALILLCVDIAIFTLWYWLDRLLLSRSVDANFNWGFSLIMTAGIILYFIGSIFAVWEETE